MTIDEIISLTEKEGDFYEWTHKYNCKIKRVFDSKRKYGGHWCGYVQLPKDHPYYNEGYEEIPDIKVHDGLSYADENGWVGFACCQLGDVKPYDIKNSKYQDPDILLRTRHYWTKEEVIKETEELADQLMKLI